MGLMDKVKAQASQLGQKAQEAAQEGKARLDQAQAQRSGGTMLRQLGALVYADRTGRGTPDTQTKIDSLISEISTFEQTNGLNLTADQSQTTVPPQGSPAPAPRRRAPRRASRARSRAARTPAPLPSRLVPSPGRMRGRDRSSGAAARSLPVTGRRPAPPSAAARVPRSWPRYPSSWRRRRAPVTACPAVPSTSRIRARPRTACRLAPGSTACRSRASAACAGGYWISVLATLWCGQFRPARCRPKPSPASSRPVLADRPLISVPL